MLQIRISIPQSSLDQVIAHARRDAPHEVCGLIAGHVREKRGELSVIAETVYSIPNVAIRPEVAFEMDHRAMVAAILAIQRTGQVVAVIYHSHPVSDAHPSASDIAAASWPDAIYLIVGYAERSDPEIGAWLIRDGQVTQAQISILR